MTTVTLFGLDRSVYTRIARLALAEKSVDYTLQEVEIFGPAGVPADHLQRHPFGKIPVLQHGAFVVYETAAITRYVDEAFVGPALQPTTPALRARVSQIIGVLDSYAYRPMVWGVYVQRVRVPLSGGTPDEAEIARSLLAADTCLAALRHLVAPAPFLLGNDITLADLHAYPMLRFFALAPEGRALLDRHGEWLAWLDRMQARPSVTTTRSRVEPVGEG